MKDSEYKLVTYSAATLFRNKDGSMSTWVNPKAPQRFKNAVQRTENTGDIYFTLGPEFVSRGEIEIMLEKEGWL